MLFNDLPDEIIELIFAKTPWIEDIINYSKVCQRWYELAHRRLNQVKYLMIMVPIREEPEPIPERNIMFYLGKKQNDPTVMVYFKLLPNLKILEINESGGPKGKIIRDIFQTRPEITGIWYHYPFASNYQDTDILSTIVIEQDESSSSQSPNNSKSSNWQLDIELTGDEIWQVLPQLTSLKRLHIDFFTANSLQEYNGQAFSNLEILELAILGNVDEDDIVEGQICAEETNNFSLLVDYCPGLKSLYLSFIRVFYYQYSCDVINGYLENLVLEYEEESHQEWTSLFPFLKKFPNLKNLAIRGNPELKDHHIRELVHHWKKLAILDVRGCENITSRSVNIVSRCPLRDEQEPLKYYWGSSSDFYHDKDHYKPICEGFDFMKHIFFVSFPNIPIFLTPNPD